MNKGLYFKKRKKILPVVISTTIILSMILSLGLSSVLAESLSEKEEVVYGLLDFDGQVESLFVVNRFSNESLQNNGGVIIDYGSYTEVRNMTSSEEIRVDGDTITINTSAEQFFYQGTLDAGTGLPWEISVNYFLDGASISPKDLAGARGSFEISIDINENPRINSAFYENYLLQVSLTVDTENFTSIASPDGVLASAGRNRIITHTVMPGEDASISVSGFAEEFIMREIEFSALPFSMTIDVPIAGGLIEDAETLSEAVSQLHDGVVSLNSGISELAGGAGDLNRGAIAFGEGYNELSGNSDQLLASSRQIRGALDQIVTELQEQDDPMSDLEELSRLSQGLREMAAGLEKMAEGMDVLQEGYSIAYSELDAAISAIPETEVDPAPLYVLVGDDEEMLATLNELMEFYASAKTTKGTYEAVKESFDSIEPALQAFSQSINKTTEALLEMEEKIDGFIPTEDDAHPLQELINAMTELSQNYHGFHAGLDDYMQGVENFSYGYQEIRGGISSLSKGLNDLNRGANELEEGTGELNKGVAELPNIIREEIERAEALYDTSDFEPVSFVSERNTEIASVQFVFRTPGIELPEESSSEIEEPEDLSFWQKLLSLFGLYGN